MKILFSLSNIFWLLFLFLTKFSEKNPVKQLNKQESAFENLKHKIIKQMFSVFAYFSRIQMTKQNKTVKTLKYFSHVR